MSSEKDFQKRLSALNREPLPGQPPDAPDVAELRRKLRKKREPAAAPPEPAAAPPEPPKSAAEKPAPDPILYRRDLPSAQPKPYRPLGGAPVDLMSAVTGDEVRGPLGGTAFVIPTDVRELSDEAGALSDAFGQRMQDPGSSARQWIAGRCELAEAAPDDVVFFDLETTGLGSSPLFLIGAMGWEAGRLVVRQYFARTYAEERAVIGLFLRSFEGKRLLVSFNGKSFDLPYVRVRSAATGVPFHLDPPHFDLLHVSRRIWRGRVPDCKLQTLERLICGRTRYGDIPGAEIPRAYHDFVRTGNAREMVECLKHNMLDLVTLADLMVRLPAPGAQA